MRIIRSKKDLHYGWNLAIVDKSGKYIITKNQAVIDNYLKKNPDAIVQRIFVEKVS